VIPGYVDIPKTEYAEFSNAWITEVSRVLKPGGSVYIVSGWSNLVHILNALHQTNLEEINHLIAQYSFGVYTKNKWVSSHYHILFWAKSGKRTFNTSAFYLNSQQSYQDRQSVQQLDREYQTGKIRYQNQLPVLFVQKYVAYSSKPGDTILDPFGGSFSTRDAALSLGRNFVGFEVNEKAFKEFGNRNNLDKFCI
jgi:site-specific DNA-methyltransferase (adenine-specific)